MPKENDLAASFCEPARRSENTRKWTYVTASGLLLMVGLEGGLQLSIVIRQNLIGNQRGGLCRFEK